jgi:hypothetical protein
MVSRQCPGPILGQWSRSTLLLVLALILVLPQLLVSSDQDDDVVKVYSKTALLAAVTGLYIARPWWPLCQLGHFLGRGAGVKNDDKAVPTRMLRGYDG